MHSGKKRRNMFMSEDWYDLFVDWARNIDLPNITITGMLDNITALRIYEILSPYETAWLFADPWEFKGWPGRGGKRY